MKRFYVEATSYASDGELIACWTTELPGKTGPRGMTSPAILLRMWSCGWRLRLRRRGGAGEETTFAPPAEGTIRAWAQQYVARARPVDPAEHEGGGS